MERCIDAELGAGATQTPELLYHRLAQWFGRHRCVAVAYSGGVDSSLVLEAAVSALGTANVLAVTADSPSLARTELAETKRFAAELGVKHLVVETSELDNEAYAKNDSLRCYHCKGEFYGLARGAAARYFAAHDADKPWVLVDGTNADDTRDIRPGLQAANEQSVAHPLVDCAIKKSEVRQLCRLRGLAVADKPEMACLASRIASGTRVDAKKLMMVERAEAALQAAGFAGVRVRYHELPAAQTGSPPAPLARIEVQSEADYSRISSDTARLTIVEALKAAGFAFVTLDLEGYKKGGRAAFAPIGASAGQGPESR